MTQPDAGAMIDVRLLDHPVRLEPEPLDTFWQDLHGAGGECIFLGRTREETHPVHGRLLRLSYECYRPMAEAVLGDLAQQAALRFQCVLVRIHHALGEVAPGQASVLVQVACGHRDKAFAACRFLIDELKRQAPIWKREEWMDGTTWSAGTPVEIERVSP